MRNCRSITDELEVGKILWRTYYPGKENSMKKRILALLSVAALTVGMFSTTASAATVSSWEVNYQRGAPTTVANPVDYATVTYSALGFEYNCTKLTGGDVVISTTAGDGIKNGNEPGNKVRITYTGKKPFGLNKTVPGNVRFQLELKPFTASTTATGKGEIRARG